MNLTTLEPTEVARSISHAEQTPGPLIARRLPPELGERRAFDRAITVVTVSFAAAGVKCDDSKSVLRDPRQQWHSRQICPNIYV
jgi:hypothetical protein